MAYALPFLKVNVEGHFGSTAGTIVERWQSGFHIIKNGGMSATPTEIVGFLTNILPIISTFHTSASTVHGSNVWLDGASGALIGVDGHYANGSLQPTTRVALGTPVAGTGTGVNSYSTALVLSLRSLILRGPASHGRMYWPMTTQAVLSSTGVLDPSQQGQIATAAQTMINGITAAAVAAFGANTYVGLVSPKGAGSQSPVAQVWVGARMDHMESREGDLPEAYVARSLSVTTALIAERDRKIRELLDQEDRDREASDVD
jgi:hypothetical protein